MSAAFPSCASWALWRAETVTLQKLSAEPFIQRDDHQSCWVKAGPRALLGREWREVIVARFGRCLQMSHLC